MNDGPQNRKFNIVDPNAYLIQSTKRDDRSEVARMEGCTASSEAGRYQYQHMTCT